jgi:hypothetical protein
MPRTRETSNPLDKVYAVLGLVSPELVKQIKIDYSHGSRENYWQLHVRLGHILLCSGQSKPFTFSAMRAPKNGLAYSHRWCLNFDSVEEVHMFLPAKYLAGGIVTHFRSISTYRNLAGR